MKKIFITRRLPPIAKNLLSKHFIVDGSDENKPLSERKLKEVVSSYDGILSTISEKFPKSILENAKNLKVLSNYAIGLDNIDLQAAKEKGISVYNTPDVVTQSTADMTFALLLSLIRKISSAQSFVKENKWSAWDPELFLGEELAGKTFGIIGFGKIGKEVAKRAQGFGLKVIYYNRSNVEPLNKEMEQVELDYLLKKSDYISLHVPLNEKTKDLITKKEIEKMEKKPLLLNLARGDVINTDALVNALVSGKIRGAALDVTNPEPISGNHPLCKMENCIIVPHIGTATKECRHNMAKLAAENIIKHFKKEIIEKQLAEVFKEVFGMKMNDLNTSMSNTSSWDSLKHVRLVSAIEKKFSIRIKFNDSLKMTNIKDIIEVIERSIENSRITNKGSIKSSPVIVEDHLLRRHQRIDKPFAIEYNNLYELFHTKMEQEPDKEFIIFPDKEETYTYTQFHKSFVKTANSLQIKNIQKGDRINLIIPNNLEFVILYFAALSSGITVVPINPDLTPREMLYIIKQSKSKAVFYSPSIQSKADKIKTKVEIALLDAEEFIQSINGNSEELFEPPKVKLTDEAVIIYTSGTTGNPKGAILTHLNLLSDSKVISEWFQFTPQTRTLCLLPLFHNNGQVITLLTPLYAGGSTVMVEGKSSLMSFWDLIENYNINWTSVMPSILSILLSMPMERKDQSMQGIICGGQVLTKELQNKFEQRFGVPIFEGYGLTETTSFACFNDFPKEKRKEGTVGREFSINQIVIMDDNGSLLEPTQEGEICIRGLNVVNEYFDLEEENKRAFRNGWFHSGDYGFKDEQGYVYFKTRKDFLIIKGGENIYPSEIENVLYKHPNVEECAAIGVHSELLGEEICAFVKLHNKGTTKEELMKFISGKIAGYKQPKELIIINYLSDLSDIPKGPTKKILYRKLSEYYTNKLYKPVQNN